MLLGIFIIFTLQCLFIEVLKNQSLKTYFKQFDPDKQLFLLKNILLKCFKIMKGDFVKTKQMMDQIVREVCIPVEKSGKNSNNNPKPTKHRNLKRDKNCFKQMAKIHGHKSCKLYKKLLTSTDPIPDTTELIKALTDENNEIGDSRSYKLRYDLGTKISHKTKNCDVYVESEGSSSSTSISTSIQNVIKIPIPNAILSSGGKSFKMPCRTKGNKNFTINIEISPIVNNEETNSLEQLPISTDSSEINRNESIQGSSIKRKIDDSGLSVSNDIKPYLDNGQCKIVSSKVRDTIIDLTTDSDSREIKKKKSIQVSSIKRKIDDPGLSVSNGIQPLLGNGQCKIVSSKVRDTIIDLTTDSDSGEINGNESIQGSSIKRKIDDSGLSVSNDIKPYLDYGQCEIVSSKVRDTIIDLTTDPDSSEIDKNESFQVSSIKRKIDDSGLSVSNDIQPCLDNEQCEIVSSKVEDTMVDITSSENDKTCPPMLKYPNFKKYCHENSTYLKKLKKIIFKQEGTNSRTFEMLVSLLKKSTKYEIKKKAKFIYQWHDFPLQRIKQLLKELLQTLNKTKNKIIHFMTLLNLLFHKAIYRSQFSAEEMYHNFFNFADFIRKCLFSYNDRWGVEWLPRLWNNSFYYGCFVVENILYNKYDHPFMEWSNIPNVKKLFKILSYDNHRRLASINNATKNINNLSEQYVLNTIVPEHQDKKEEPPKHTIPITSDDRISQQAQQARRTSKLMITVESPIRESQNELNLITPQDTNISKSNRSLLDDRVPEEPYTIHNARIEHE